MVTASPLAIGFVAFLVASLRRTKSTPSVGKSNKAPRRRLASHPRGWQLQGGESFPSMLLFIVVVRQPRWENWWGTQGRL